VLEVWAGGVIAVVVVGVAHFLDRLRLARRGASLLRAAETCRLTDVVVLKARAWGTTPAVQGRLGALRVRLERVEATIPATIVIAIQRLGHGSSGLRIVPRGSSRGARGGEEEVPTGDPEFDEAVAVSGARDMVFALLDEDTRRKVRALTRPAVDPTAGSTQPPFRVEGSELHAVLDPSILDHTSAFQAHVRPLLALAEQLVPPEDIPQRVADTVARDPLSTVRARALAALFSEYPDTALTKATARAALTDLDAEVRLNAALALGAEGDPVLVEIASAERTPDVVAARALAKLGGRMPRDLTLEILRNAVPLRRNQTALACIKIIATRADEEGVRALARALRLASDDVAVEATWALGLAGHPAAEPGLIDALAHSAAAVRLAAVEALGRSGTAVCIPALQQAAQTRENNAALREAVRDAVAAVQSRLRGATPGQLSLSSSAAGQISLPADTSGKVSLTDE
jgi:HEAT repeat protein